VRLTLPSINHDKLGFESLIKLHAQAKNNSFEDIEISLLNVNWFDADMCAAFGAILYQITDNVNNIKLTNIPPQITTIFEKNGFLGYYGHLKISDQWGTTIPYQRFDTKDDRYFADYIERELMPRSEVPSMSPRLQKKFQESIFEIFSNAVLHSQTKLGIFSCGQFYPAKHRLYFSVADLGMGICKNIKETIGLDFSPEEAIVWATSEANTTKRGNVPGGLGLKLLQEFIDLNGGSIQIVSDAGYWKRENGQIFTERLKQPFPGTVISIEIKTDDNSSYMLTSELKPEDIF
jgi:hypothetical protein